MKLAPDMGQFILPPRSVLLVASVLQFQVSPGKQLALPLLQLGKVGGLGSGKLPAGWSSSSGGGRRKPSAKWMKWILRAGLLDITAGVGLGKGVERKLSLVR